MAASRRCVAAARTSWSARRANLARASTASTRAASRPRARGARGRARSRWRRRRRGGAPRRRGRGCARVDRDGRLVSGASGTARPTSGLGFRTGRRADDPAGASGRAGLTSPRRRPRICCRRPSSAGGARSSADGRREKLGGVRPHGRSATARAAHRDEQILEMDERRVEAADAAAGRRGKLGTAAQREAHVDPRGAHSRSTLRISTRHLSDLAAPMGGRSAARDGEARRRRGGPARASTTTSRARKASAV